MTQFSYTSHIYVGGNFITFIFALKNSAFIAPFKQHFSLSTFNTFIDTKYGNKDVEG